MKELKSVSKTVEHIRKKDSKCHVDCVSNYIYIYIYNFRETFS